jgi:hypothetical protein
VVSCADATDIVAAATQLTTDMATAIRFDFIKHFLSVSGKRTTHANSRQWGRFENQLSEKIRVRPAARVYSTASSRIGDARTQQRQAVQLFAKARHRRESG